MAEEVQEGVQSDDNGNVLWVTSIADPTAPTVAELAAGVPITYGLVTVDHQTTVNTINTTRWTLGQQLELEGSIVDTVELTYVYGRDAAETDVQTTLGTKGTKGFLVESYGYASDHTYAASDVINAVIPGTLGTSRDVPPAANTELQKIVKVNVTGKVQREVVVAA